MTEVGGGGLMDAEKREINEMVREKRCKTRLQIGRADYWGGWRTITK